MSKTNEDIQPKMSKSVENLCKKRAVMRAAVTKAVNKLETELAKSEVDANIVEELVEILTLKFEMLSAVDSELEANFEPNELEKEIETSEEYREKVTVWKFRATKRINEMRQNSLEVSRISENQNRSFETSSNSTIRDKLPKLTIAKFYGDVSQWLTFWNSFESAIHKNELLNNVDKFNYLKAYLGGTAMNTVEGFPITAENYDNAIRALKDRYAETDLLISAHMNNIINMQPLRDSNDVRAFRRFYDNCTTQIRCLEALGLSSENYTSVLCPLLLKILPADLVLEYSKLESNTHSNLTNLLDFLSKSLMSRERAMHIMSVNINQISPNETFAPHRQNTVENRVRNDSRKNRKQIATASELISTDEIENPRKIKCVFCDSFTHFSSECESASNLSLEERKNILMKKGACFKCLEIRKHISRFCKANVNCKHCKGKHSSLMCFTKYKQKLNVDKNVPPENSVLSNQSSSNEVYLQT
ncbi:uncharacterized protein LOC129222889 [Uloborus diversus]|uniref:uncharacterized protein LOC129222889 n=1 Tax=Uloborus diversus TaxID=327109 RepID=UPI002409B7DE|nr:uncharacterized protein LOC129222889 [Uloborus diversus]